VTPDAVDFGVVDVGERVSRSIALANVGGDDLVLNELRLAHEDSTIELVGPGAGDTLAAGASADLSLSWSPDRADAMESKLRIGSNDPVAPIVAVWLTGATATPSIDVDPSHMDFGEVTVGSSSEQPIVIRNVGYADLEIQSVTYLVSDPSELHMKPVETPVVIAPGSSFEAWTSYTPDDEIDDHGMLTVQSDDPFTPVVHVEQKGSGVVSPDTGP
jgi:hypothetical protein